MTSINELFLLADQLKLSLLERQRSVALGLAGEKQDAQLGRTLTNLQQGIDRLAASTRPSDDAPVAGDSNSDLTTLQQQYEDLYFQFHGVAPPPRPPPPTSPPSPAQTRRNHNVPFRDDPNDDDDTAAASNRAALFADSQRYRDDPDDGTPPDQSHLDNVQIHAAHTQALRDQDEQLDTLSHSVGRQRMLGIQMGHELDEQNGLLTDVEAGVDRHASTLGRARRNLGTFARKSRDNCSWITIAVLIVILVLLIAVLK